MSFLSLKRIITGTLLLIILAFGVYYFIFSSKEVIIPVVTVPVITPKYEVVGTSVQGRKIEAYTYGTGEKNILFVGGMHGGYEWNGVYLAYKFIDYLNLYPQIIPKNLTVTIIPSFNPDGVFKVMGKEGRFTLADIPAGVSQAPGRFNANAVDLNRNFDCKWKPIGTWQGKTVSAGSAAFSEPETKALRDYILKIKPVAVIFWHSQANAVYASECLKGILPETLNIMNAYSFASGYPAVKSFTSYEINGDAEGWLASVNIPAISVELKTHETVEWEQNLAGVKGLLNYYSPATVTP